MWHSLEQIILPGSLEEALQASGSPKTRLMAGGSYLVAEANPQTRALIDIQPLLGGSLEESEENLILDAGLSLESIIRRRSDEDLCRLAEAARWSCFSKNIRNQRTLGGEVAQGRTDSELNVYLHAMQTELDVYIGKSSSCPIGEWDGEGILTRIRLNVKDVIATDLQRFALLPSAPAFLILAGVRREGSAVFAAAGKCSGIETITFSIRPEKADFFEFVKSMEFQDDHHGSVAYQGNLLIRALMDSREALWP